MAWRKNAWALAVSRCSRSSTSTAHAVFVDGSIQVALMSFAEEEHLIHEPLLADRTSAATHLGGQPRSERLDPVEDGAV